MRLQIIAIGKRMPEWAELGFGEYAKRFPKDFSLSLKEISTAHRYNNSNITQLVHQEALKIQACISPNSFTVALDVKGKVLTSENLATQLELWSTKAPVINFIIGGPDGLAQSCLDTAHYKWSLSALTLPHPLVRVMLVEQLYRAYSINQNHPYHR